jgi:hypothetical protein
MLIASTLELLNDCTVTFSLPFARREHARISTDIKNYLQGGWEGTSQQTSGRNVGINRLVQLQLKVGRNRVRGLMYVTLANGTRLKYKLNGEIHRNNICTIFHCTESFFHDAGTAYWELNVVKNTLDGRFTGGNFNAEGNEIEGTFSLTKRM